MSRLADDVPVRFVPFYDMPFFSQEENRLFRGATWVYWEVQGVEYGEVTHHWGGTWSGGRTVKVRPVVVTWRTQYPVRNLELFKTLADVRRIFGHDDIVQVSTTPTGEWRDHTDSWYVEPHRRGGSYDADRITN